MKDVIKKITYSFFLAVFLCFYSTIEFSMPGQFIVAFFLSYVLIEVVMFIEGFSYYAIYTDTYVRLKRIEEKLMKRNKHEGYCYYSYFMQSIFSWLKQDVIPLKFFTLLTVNSTTINTIEKKLENRLFSEKEAIVRIDKGKSILVYNIFMEERGYLFARIRDEITILRPYQVYKRRKLFMEILQDYAHNVYLKVRQIR